MTPKEKAMELYNFYNNLCRDFTKGVSIKELAKLSALKSIDEILNTGTLLDENMALISSCNELQMLDFWKEVKHELENI